MTHDIDRYEEKWGDFGEDTRHRRPQHGRHKPKPDEMPKPTEPTEAELAAKAEAKITRHIDSRWGELPEEEREGKLKTYRRWIKDSLDAGFPILDDGDTKSTMDEKAVLITHLPTLIGAKRSTSEDARGVVFERLESHLKLWKQASPEFKKQILNPEEPGKGPEVDFFYVTHHPANIEKIWQKIKDYDIYLVEVYGSSKLEREAWEDLVNTVSSETNEKKRDLMVRVALGGSDFLSLIKQRIAKDGKKYKVIDIDESHPAIGFDEEAKQTVDNVTTFLTLGLFRTAFDSYRLENIQSNQSSHMREYRVAEQVEEFLKENADTVKGKRICVIQGRAHRQTYRIFKRSMPEIKSSRSFLEPRVVFPLTMEAQERTFAGSYKDRELALKRDFLGMIFVINKLTHAGVKIQNMHDEVARITRKIDNETVEKIFARLTTIEDESSRILSSSVSSDPNQSLGALHAARAYADREAGKIYEEYFDKI